MYASYSALSVNKAFAVDTCLSSSFVNSAAYVSSRFAAISVAFIKQSVTFGSPFTATPIADTIPIVNLESFFIKSSHTPPMRSALPTHVPPNLSPNRAPSPSVTARLDASTFPPRSLAVVASRRASSRPFVRSRRRPVPPSRSGFHRPRIIHRPRVPPPRASLLPSPPR